MPILVQYIDCYEYTYKPHFILEIFSKVKVKFKNGFYSKIQKKIHF